MFRLKIKYIACGEEVFARDNEGYETWVYSCNTCEEAERKAEDLRQAGLKNETLKQRKGNLKTRNFQKY